MAHAFLRAQSFAAIQFCAKVSFESRQMAMRAIRRLRVNSTRDVAFGDGVLNAYQCKACRGWHVGHAHKKTNKYAHNDVDM